MEATLTHDRPEFHPDSLHSDRTGIVAGVSRFLFENGCNIIDSAQFGDRDNGKFSLRISLASESGARAHYVTSDLDEGPIIEQSVDHVTHAMSAEDYAAAGRDIESSVLARAVKWYAELHILINRRRTVVFYYA